MKKEVDIYNYPMKLRSAINTIEKKGISPRNKQIIYEFRDYCSLNGIGLPRTWRYLTFLPHLAEMLGKDFDQATKEDMMRVIRIIQEHPKHTPWTKVTHKKIIKRFYKWLKNTGDVYPEEVKWIKANIARTERKLINNAELWTEKEVKQLVDAAEHPRDKAFISCLYESGARVGELASLQIGNVSFDEYGVILNVQGKTGARPVRVISSTSYLTTWVQSHPFKDDFSAPLWVNVGTRHHGEMMNYPNIKKRLQEICAKAGIKKRCNPHMFRHSRATFLADHLTEFQMNQYFGWIQGSNMPSTYVHMNGMKIDSSILALNGVQRTQESKESCLKPKICPKCSTINSSDSKFCNNCAGILDTQTAIEMQTKALKEKEITNHSNELMNRLLKDKSFMAIMAEKIKEMGIADKL